MTKTMVVGDTHMNRGFARRAVEAATTSGIEVIIQLGDFAFTNDMRFIQIWVDWLRDDEGRSMFWIDGNHDNHDYIEDQIIGDLDPSRPIAHWQERMFYCPRGSVQQIGETWCQFLGGAYSIDRGRRIPHVTWWEQEMLTEGDVIRALANSEGRDIEYMFTHDCPNTTWFKGKLDQDAYKVDPASEANRRRVTTVVEAVRPRHVYHGHYHESYETVLFTESRAPVEVHGVGADSGYERGKRINYRPTWGLNIERITL